MLATVPKWILLVCNTLAIVIGLALVLVSDALARIEVRLNQWYSPRALSKNMDVMHMTPDKWVRAHPHTAGWIMMILSIFVVPNLGVIVLSRH